jgi:hypothetical protein
LGKTLLIFDFFAGTGSSTQAFADAGDTVITFELDPFFTVTETVNIMDLTVEGLLEKYGQPDFIWASPPCQAFSVASIGHHWANGGDNPTPKTELAEYNQLLVAKTKELIFGLKPKQGFLIENPRGMLRKLPVVADLPRRTVTYCQYGDDRQKPTDLWGVVRGGVARETYLSSRFGLPRCRPARFDYGNAGSKGFENSFYDSLRAWGRDSSSDYRRAC